MYVKNVNYSVYKERFLFFGQRDVCRIYINKDDGKGFIGEWKAGMQYIREGQVGKG